MNIDKENSEAKNRSENPQDYDLAADEIKLVKTIGNMKNMIQHIENLDHQPASVNNILSNISELQSRLDELKARRK